MNNSKTISLIKFCVSNTGENKCLDKTIDVAVDVLINWGVEECEQPDTKAHLDLLDIDLQSGTEKLDRSLGTEGLSNPQCATRSKNVSKNCTVSELCTS